MNTERYREILEKKRQAMIANALRSLGQDMILDENEKADEIDLASSEYLHAFSLRLRSREKGLLHKLTYALERIDRGEFGLCEECGEKIGAKRLLARPETTMCIDCKEAQEHEERNYAYG